jgi:hypothetical protein
MMKKIKKKLKNKKLSIQKKVIKSSMFLKKFILLTQQFEYLWHANDKIDIDDGYADVERRVCPLTLVIAENTLDKKDDGTDDA